MLVSEDEREAYEKQDWPDGWEVVAIPPEEDGNIAKARNAILNRYQGREIVMADDDYQYLGMWLRGEQIRLDHERVEEMLATGFQMARDVGTPIWGINVQVDRRFYREHAPFAFLSVVLGTFMGVLGDLLPADLRFDEDLWLKEDYDFSLKVLHRFHRTFRLSRYHYMVDHHSLPGGAVTTRNMAEEERQNRKLEARWGSSVVKVQLHRSPNPIIKVPLRGI